MEVVELMHQQLSSIHPEFELIQQAKDLLGKSWETTITHIPRNMNTVADSLAKQALKIFQGYHSIIQAPPDLLYLIHRDCVVSSSVG